MTTRNSSVRGKKDVAVMAKTYEEIAEAFGEYVSELLQIFLLKLDSKGIFDYSKVRMFNIQRSNELLKNLDMVEDKIPVLELSFKSCPYNPDIYAKLLEFGIYDVDSFATAKEFGLETFLNPLVIDLCKKRLENIEKNPELLKILALLRDETENETIKFLYSKDINDILNEYSLMEIMLKDKKALDEWMRKTISSNTEDLIRKSQDEINDIINMTISKIVTEQKIEKLINIGALRIEQIRLEESKETDLPSINKEYEKEINKCVGMYISEANERKKSFEEAKQTFNSEIKKQYYAIELKRNELKNLGFLSFAKKKELRVEIEKLEAQLIRYKTENYPTSLKMAFENMYMDTN